MAPRAGERTTVDPMAASLNELSGNTLGRHVLKVEHLFGSRPEVLESIKSAKARGCSASVIADALSRDGSPVSASAVENWLKAQRPKLTAVPK